MTEVIICDTNAAIHLAIICPDILRQPPKTCHIALHPLVKTELHKLNRNPEKAQRLQSVFDFLQQNVISYTQLTEVNAQQKIKDHTRLKKFEEGLPNANTASSSHYDRELLILAKKNSKKLLTNDRKLHQISTAFIGSDKTWRTGDALSYLLKENLLTSAQIQEGLGRLKEPHKETLCVECIQLLKKLGFSI